MTVRLYDCIKVEPRLYDFHHFLMSIFVFTSFGLFAHVYILLFLSFRLGCVGRHSLTCFIKNAFQNRHNRLFTRSFAHSIHRVRSGTWTPRSSVLFSSSDLSHSKRCSLFSNALYGSIWFYMAQSVCLVCCWRCCCCLWHHTPQPIATACNLVWFWFWLLCSFKIHIIFIWNILSFEKRTLENTTSEPLSVDGVASFPMCKIIIFHTDSFQDIHFFYSLGYFVFHRISFSTDATVAAAAVACHCHHFRFYALKRKF